MRLPPTLRLPLQSSLKPRLSAFAQTQTRRLAIQSPVKTSTRRTAPVAPKKPFLDNSSPARPLRPFHTTLRGQLKASDSNMASAIDQLSSKVAGLSLSSVKDKYPTTFPETNILDVYRAHLADVLSGIAGVDPAIALTAIQWTSGLEKGDFSVPVPAFRIKGEKPDALAQKWGEQFPKDDPLFEPPTIAGTFMSFFIRGEGLTKAIIPDIRQKGLQFGRNTAHGLRDQKNPEQGRKRIIVEFSSPNVAKPFHAGHLRSTIIGSFLSNIYEAGGWEVTRINYLGDWGKQYGLLALAFERYGDEQALSRDPIDHLFQLYVRINAEKEDEAKSIEAQKNEGKDVTELLNNSLDEQARQYFRRMVDGDQATLDLWRRFRDLSIARYRETYARLNIAFDSYSGESQVSEDAMAGVATQMAEKNISKEDKGANVVDFTTIVPGKEGKRLGTAVVRKKDGTALYLTRDISELLNRHEQYGFDRMLYVVASQQELHLKQLFKIVELLGHEDIAKRCEHISFGLVLGMSTRKGTVKFLNDILKDCADYMHEVMRKNETKYSQIENPEATADILGISSVMVQDMRGKRINNYKFSMDDMTSFEGDTGPYLQYAHARLCSIKRRAELTDDDLASADLSLLTEPHAINVARIIAQWPDVFGQTLKTQEPTTILTYLFKMTHVVSSSYDHLQVVGSEPELKKARMALYDAATLVLCNGMKLLGLSPLERM